MVKHIFFHNRKIKGLFCAAFLAKLLLALYQVATAQLTLMAFAELEKGTWAWPLLLVMLALSAGYGLMLYLSLWVGKVIKNRLECAISLHTMRNHLGGRLKQVRLGEATVRLTRDAATASAYFDDYLMPLTEFILTCGCAVVFIAAQSPMMAGLYAAMGLFYYLAARRFYERTVALSEKFKTRQDAFMTYFQETIRSLPLIRVFRCAPWRRHRFEQLVREQEEDFRLLTDANAKNESFLFAGIYFAEFISLGMGLWLTVATDFSLAQLLSIFSLGINTILYQCLMLPGALAHAVDIRTSFRRLEGEAAAPAAEAETEAGDDVTRIEGSIGFHYPGEERWLFENLSLALAKGCVTWIAGPNGSGKSTLTQILMRELQPSAGEVFFLNDRGERRSKAGFAFVPEDHQFFRVSLRENLTLGRAVPDQALLGALREMGLLDEKGSGGEILDRVMFEELQFSEGQLRRLSVIRALLAPADFIVYDEPFSDLDHASQEKVMAMIRGSLGSAGAIIISHTYDLVQAGDNVIRLGGFADA